VDAPAQPTSSPSETRREVVGFIGRWGSVLVFVGLLILGAIINWSAFVSLTNVRQILLAASFGAIIAMGLTLVLIVGEFDLSVAAVATFSGVCAVSLIQRWEVSLALSIVAALVLAALVGLINGLIVTKLRIHSFIATLAMSIILLAGSYAVSGGEQRNLEPGSSYVDIGRWQTLKVFATPTIIAAVLAIGLASFLRRTVPGRHLYAVGGNRAAAYLAGIRVERVVVAAFVACAFLSGIGGVLLSMNFGYADINLADGYLLPVFAAAFIGAATVRLGEFHIWGTVFGAVMLQVVVVLVLLSGLPPELGLAFQGLVLIVAVALSSVASGRSAGPRKL
jgi:ribose transport system permease protein